MNNRVTGYKPSMRPGGYRVGASSRQRGQAAADSHSRAQRPPRRGERRHSAVRHHPCDPRGTRRRPGPCPPRRRPRRSGRGGSRGRRGPSPTGDSRTVRRRGTAIRPRAGDDRSVRRLLGYRDRERWRDHLLRGGTDTIWRAGGDRHRRDSQRPVRDRAVRPGPIPSWPAASIRMSCGCWPKPGAPLTVSSATPTMRLIRMSRA